MPPRTWLVGLDGSDTSYKSLRLATMVMDPEVDDVKILHIHDPSKEEAISSDALMSNGEIECRKAHVRHGGWSIEHTVLSAPPWPAPAFNPAA